MNLTNENPTIAPVVAIRPELLEQLLGAVVQPDPWMRAETMPDFLTPDQFAQYIGVSRQQVYHMRSAETAPQATFFGKHMRFARKDVLEWAEGTGRKAA